LRLIYIQEILICHISSDAVFLEAPVKPSSVSTNVSICAHKVKMENPESDVIKLPVVDGVELIGVIRPSFDSPTLVIQPIPIVHLYNTPVPSSRLR